MKLLFRRKSDGHILKPIQTLEAYVRLHHEASDKIWWAKKAKLPVNFDVFTHDIERGDVMRDIRDGQLWVVEYTYRHGLRMTSRKDGVAGNMVKGMTYFGLINYERVGRKYRLRGRQPHEKAYKTYDASKAQELVRSATHEIINRFDAVTNAQRQAREYGVGFIRVEQDGSMSAIDPSSVILR